MDLNDKVETLSFNHNEHVEETNSFQTKAESNLDLLHSKVSEIRQIVGSTAMSNGKGIISSNNPTAQLPTRNRSRSPTKKAKNMSSESSSNSIENVSRQKRSKSPVKPMKTTKPDTEPIEKRRKKLTKVRPKESKDENKSEELEEDPKPVKEDVTSMIEVNHKKPHTEDEDMEEFMQDDSSNDSEM